VYDGLNIVFNQSDEYFQYFSISGDRKDSRGFCDWYLEKTFVKNECLFFLVVKNDKLESNITNYNSLGCVFFYNLQKESNMLGGTIIEKEKGKGYCTLAVSMILNLQNYLEKCGLWKYKVCKIIIHPNNKASQKVASKLGFILLRENIQCSCGIRNEYGYYFENRDR
jgi:RimJ/RimL family protein N-acetyltransferase